MQKFVPFFQGEKRIITERLAEYFDKNGLETQTHYDESLDAYILSVPAEKINEAKKLYQDFYFEELERVEREEKNKDFMQNYDEANIFAKSQDDISSNVENVSVSDMETSAPKSVSGPDAFTEDDTYSNDVAAAGIENDDAFKTEPNGYMEKEYTYRSDDADNTDYGSQPDNTDKTNDTVPADNIGEAGQPKADEPEETDDEDMDELKRLLSGPGNYKFKYEKYRDYIESCYTFLSVGIAGLVFVILNIADVLHIFNDILTNLVMGALFIFFIYEGISSGVKARKLKPEAEEENRLTEKINEWLKNNVTREFLNSIGRSGQSEELDYIEKTDTIRDMLIKEFGDINTDYLDRIIEEYYSKNFD